MTTWWRSTLALVLCAVGAVTLGPSPTAAADPAPSVGVGTVLADLGEARAFAVTGFSPDGAYYVYGTPAGDQCDLRLYDVRARRSVALTHDRVACYGNGVGWAARSSTLVWQADGVDKTAAAYVWTADSGVRVAVPGGVTGGTSLSADGRFLVYAGGPAGEPDVPAAARVLDRATGASRPLTAPGVDVQFREWGPTGHRFVADTTALDSGVRGTCFGEGTTCGVLTTYTYFGNQTPSERQWSPDGTAVLGFDQVVFDFTDRSFTPFPRGLGFSADPVFLDDDRVAGPLDRGAFLWNRRTGDVTRMASGGLPSPDGRYLLVGGGTPEAVRYRNVRTGAEALATYRGSTDQIQPGYWIEHGSSFLGLGPGGCSSLRQWSPGTNTVSLFGPPGLRTCFRLPYPRATSTWTSAFRTYSSASGRFALIVKRTEGAGDRDVVADLRRHVLLGPLEGEVQAFAPAGPDVLSVARRVGATTRLLLVDPTPAPDVDDKPRWSASTPGNGARVGVAPGGRVQVRLGASEPQGAPVNLYFRWRDSAGVPIKSSPKGWTCERKRLAAGATVADCTFAPPARGWTATRFLDVSATNFATGAQSDTRSYRVAVVR